MKLPSTLLENPSVEGGFWNYAVFVYSRPGISEVCLKLQNEFDVDIPLLLFAGWIGAVWKISLTHEQAAHLQNIVACWQAQVVKKLRTMRQDLKAKSPPVSALETELLRDCIKSAKLQAEKIQMMLLENYALENYTHGSPASSSSASANIHTIFKLCSGLIVTSHAQEFLDVLERALHAANDL